MNPTRALHCDRSCDGLDRARIARAIDALGRRRPRVHALVAPVVQPFTANVAAALGIDISMTTDADQVAVMAGGSDAVCANLGMLDPARRAGIASAARSGRPLVLDPVKVDRVPERLDFARDLLGHAAVVKGNAAEMAALGALPQDTVGVTTGRIDRVWAAGGGRAAAVANGTPLLQRVTGTGCAGGVLIAALLAVEPDPFHAAVAALALMGVAGESAARRSAGPGSFAANLVDALAEAGGAEVAARVRPGPPPLDPALYLVVGPDAGDPLPIVRAAVAGGATLVQWRDKTGDTASQVAAVRRLVAAVSVPVLVNDRADVALAAGAAGVHVGHGDLTPAEARAIVGPDAIVGLTVHTMAEAEAADDAPIDYASVGAVFATASKDNPQEPIGVDGFAALAARLRRGRALPVIAIAGIDEARARALAAAGADGVAVMSAVTRAADPVAAAAALLRAVRAARP